MSDLADSCRRINEFLADEEAKISKPKESVVVFTSPLAWVSVTSNPISQRQKIYFTPLHTKGVVRAGSGRTPEFPEGGDPRFRAVLAEMLRIHISKSNDYGTGADIYANYRSAEAVDVPAWKSCFIRALEKVQRLTNAFGGKTLNHESVTDSFIDLANHIVISKVLYDEAKPEAEPCCGGNCDC